MEIISLKRISGKGNFAHFSFLDIFQIAIKHFIQSFMLFLTDYISIQKPPIIKYTLNLYFSKGMKDYNL